MKDFLEEKGLRNLYGSKDSTREAFQRGLIEKGDVWMDMIRSRNLSLHTYNPDIARSIARAIVQEYYQAFKQLIGTLNDTAQSIRP